MKANAAFPCFNPTPAAGTQRMFEKPKRDGTPAAKEFLTALARIILTFGFSAILLRYWLDYPGALLWAV
jgi:hypothetical protein